MSYLDDLFGVAGKTAVVTGGATGIGRMMAEALVRAGARVLIASRKGADCARGAGELTAIVPGSAAGFAGAGGSAALGGVLASWTTLPVIGVPLASSELKGMDALLATAQMPPGIHVACMAVGSWGVRNAAFFAAEILGLKHESIRESYEEYRRQLRER